jgi:hypothetical protein
MRGPGKSRLLGPKFPLLFFSLLPARRAPLRAKSLLLSKKILRFFLIYVVIFSFGQVYRAFWAIQEIVA